MNDSFDAPVHDGGALAAGVRFARLHEWSSVAVRGADRQSFLHNFSTNDIKRLVAGTSCEAFFCNVKGRVIGHGLVTFRDEELVIIGPPGQGASLAAHLDRYVIREDVALRDTTSERDYVAVFGSKRLSQLADAAGVATANVTKFQVQHVNAATQLDGTNVRWIAWPLAGQDSALIETSASELARVETWLKRHGVTICDPNAFETARIEAGTPLFGVDFDDGNFPQEVGRDAEAISFTKGCYLGQETVARIDALGHVNQRLVGVKFAGEMPPTRGAELTDQGKAVGWVTSSAYSMKLGAPLALAMVRRERADAGSLLDSPVGACEVVALPV